MTPRSDANLRLLACEYMQAAAWSGTQHGTTHPRRTLGLCSIRDPVRAQREHPRGYGLDDRDRAWAHTVLGNLKTWLRGTFHGVSPKHLQRYLDEFVFRFDRRWRETELFIRVLRRALDALPCPHQQLTAERVGAAVRRGRFGVSDSGVGRSICAGA